LEKMRIVQVILGMIAFFSLTSRTYASGKMVDHYLNLKCPDLPRTSLVKNPDRNLTWTVFNVTQLKDLYTFPGRCSSGLPLFHTSLILSAIDDLTRLIDSLKTCMVKFPKGSFQILIDTNTGDNQLILSGWEAVQHWPIGQTYPLIQLAEVAQIELARLASPGIEKTGHYTPPRRVDSEMLVDLFNMARMGFRSVSKVDFQEVIVSKTGTAHLEVGPGRCPGLCFKDRPYTCHRGRSGSNDKLIGSGVTQPS